jgi:tight adherence protein C
MTRALGLVLIAVALAALAVRELSVGWGGRRRLSGAPRWARSVRMLAALGHRVGVLPAPGDLVARLAAAGAPLGLGPGDLMAVKAGAALVGAVITTPLVAAAPARPGLLAVGGAVAAGYLAPDLWLRRRATARTRAIAVELADVVDLLRVCVEAGLTPDRALAEVAARHGGLLARELGTAAARIAVGVDRERALGDLRAAAPSPAVAALVAAMRRSARHGAPLGPALEAIALDARAEHARALTEHAARAAPKIQLVVALLLVPAVMLLVGAAVLRGLGVA